MNNGKRKLMIVIEETGFKEVAENGEPGNGFMIYLEGDTERLDIVKPADLSAAEFWGSRLFSICADIVKKCGGLERPGVKQ
jgi:hypothetical protein